MRLSVPLSHYVAHLAYMLSGAFVTDVRLQNLFVFQEKGSRGNNETKIKAHIVRDEAWKLSSFGAYGAFQLNISYPGSIFYWILTNFMSI